MSVMVLRWLPSILRPYNFDSPEARRACELIGGLLPAYPPMTGSSPSNDTTMDPMYQEKGVAHFFPDHTGFSMLSSMRFVFAACTGDGNCQVKHRTPKPSNIYYVDMDMDAYMDVYKYTEGDRHGPVENEYMYVRRYGYTHKDMYMCIPIHTRYGYIHVYISMDVDTDIDMDTCMYTYKYGG